MIIVVLHTDNNNVHCLYISAFIISHMGICVSLSFTFISFACFSPVSKLNAAYVQGLNGTNVKVEILFENT